MKFEVFGLTSVQFYSELCTYHSIYNIKNVTFKLCSACKLPIVLNERDISSLFKEDVWEQDTKEIIRT
jgi:hypothetical protein